jgi:hypothetical protein
MPSCARATSAARSCDGEGSASTFGNSGHSIAAVTIDAAAVIALTMPSMP